MTDRPIRIQLSRAKGWRMPPNTAKVDRSTKWGNPWAAGKTAFDGRSPIDNEGAVGMFRDMLDDPGKRDCADYPEDDDLIRELRGKNLACWCKPGQPCHADVLLELANPAACAMHGRGAQ